MRTDDISNTGPRPTSAPRQKREEPPEVVPVVVFEQQEPPSEAPTPPKEPKRWGTIWKVALAVIAAYVASNLVMGMFALGAMTLAIGSCTRSCSDSPVGDTADTKAFIKDMTTNERDLATFDALRGCIDALHDRRVSWSSDETKAQVLSVDELRTSVAQGAWPGTSAGYDDVDSATNPQLWVRIAELSQDEIERETGERWEVVDFAYPFPDNGPIPVPPKRDENSSVIARLVCQSGEDEGLYALVTYWRWEQPARFEVEVEAARTARAEALKRSGRVEGIEALQGRQYIVSNGSFYVWEQGADDPLRDPEQFTSFVNEAGWSLGYVSVTLLAADTPINVRYLPLSYNYPNNLPVRAMMLEQCREALANADGALEFDHAAGDALLRGYYSDDNPCTTDRLTGPLAPNPRDDYASAWYQPGAGAIVDDTLAQTVAPSMNVAGPEQVIAISVREPSWHDDRKDETLRTWVVVPKGALPEDPEGFCSAINGMRDDIWYAMGPEAEGDGTCLQYSRFYVIDETSISLNGQALTFDELRTLALTDMDQLDQCSFDVLLAGYPSMSQWGDEEEPDPDDCTPDDVGGIIARSRAWRYDS